MHLPSRLRPVLVSLIAGLFLSVVVWECRRRGQSTKGSDDGHAGTPGVPGWDVSDVIIRVALLVTALGTAGFIGCIVAAIWTGQWIRFGKYAVGCLAAIAASQAAYTYGLHIEAITWCLVVVLVLCLLVYGWLHRRDLEKPLGRDLDGDGVIGTPKRRP